MKIVVGMSGGVDSSVAALLLKQAGHEVIGLFMKNWEETHSDGSCHSEQDYADVVSVCAQIGIPCYTVNFAQQYLDNVFSQFLEDLKKGLTPNPDILCNREIKFKALLEKAMDLGADYLATGHYAQTAEGRLLKGKDKGKDQSYFLYTLKDHLLSKVLFPVGHLEKSEVRALALEAGLATAKKKDSTGICFIGKRNFREFVHRYLAYQSGNFETPQGKVVGTHVGAAYYTIGQRKGLMIGGPGDAWFVIGKDLERNVVIVDQGADHPALYAPGLIATDVSWIAAPPSFPFTCKAKIRYRQEDQECMVALEGPSLKVEFVTPQRAITPGQSIVFYQDQVCLGGAVITSLFRK